MVIGFLSPTVIPYRDIAEVSLKKGIATLWASSATLKLKGTHSSYTFNLRDPKRFVELVKSRPI